MKAPLLLDVSRLLARAQRGAPTGIDRVEFAYAEQLLRIAPERLQFVAIDRLDRLRALPLEPMRRFIAALGAGWSDGAANTTDVGAAARMIWVQATLRPSSWSPRRQVVRPIYLLISHRHLHRRERVARALATSGARLVAFVHDLIPIQYPEYARPQHAEIHLRRIQTVASLSDAVIVNSAATGAALQPYLDQAGRAPPVLVAPLGVQPRPVGQGVAVADPYFVYLSTIEPRKNHLSLLHIWRRLAETMGPATPRLVLVGRRGWENEMIVDMLERSTAIHPYVSELSEITDARIGALLHDCRALLFPSFAEGFGLPLAEALMVGVPVLSSDLPALREVGGDVPEYLDPLDGRGWLDGIRDYAVDPSPRRDAQMARMSTWHAPTWPHHMEAALGFIDALPRERAAA